MLEIGVLRRIFGLKAVKWQHAGEKMQMQKFIIYTLHKCQYKMKMDFLGRTYNMHRGNT
jgi:hypothetical protein